MSFLPFGPKGPTNAITAGGQRQPPRGALNLTHALRPHSPRMDRGGPLMSLLQSLATRRLTKRGTTDVAKGMI